MSYIKLGFIVGIGFCAIGTITWFFSSRRGAFIQFFGAGIELQSAARGLPRGEDFRAGMRVMATLQFGVGVAIAAVTSLAWLMS